MPQINPVHQPYTRAFVLSRNLLLGVFMAVLAGAMGSRQRYTPLDYHLNSSFPRMQWNEYLPTKTDDAIVPVNAGFLGAAPYNTRKTVTYRFRYPFAIHTVRISDQHTQWGEGDQVTLWASPNGRDWTLCYDRGERSRIVDFAVTSTKTFAGQREVWLKYELSAGDPNRPPDDNRGASIRAFRVQVAFQNPLPRLAWNGVRMVLLPGLAILTLLLFVLSRERDVHRGELAMLLCLMAGAFAVRSGFLLSVRHIPVFADAFYYNIGALDLLAFVLHPANYLKQSQIKELIGGLFAKGPIYNFYLTITYLLFGEEHFMAVRFGQAVLDTMTCLLVWVLGRSLHNRVISLMAGVFYALYLPFWVAADRLLQETLAIFLLTLTIVLFVKLLDAPSVSTSLITGVMLGLTVLCRQALNYLMYPLLLTGMGLLLLKRSATETLKKALFRSGALIGGVLLILLPWLILAAAVFHKPILSASPTFYQPFYKGIVNQGWQADVAQIDADGVMARLLQERGHATPDYDDFRDAFVSTVKAQPLQFLANGLHNFYYYWERPYNDFFQVFLFPLSVQYVFHRLLVLLALWGIAYSLLFWQRSVFLLLPIAYIGLIEMLHPVERRHALPAFPFIMVMSAYAIWWMGKNLISSINFRTTKGRVSIGLMLFCAGLYGASTILTEPHILSLCSQCSASQAHGVSLGIFTILLIGVGMLTYHIAPPFPRLPFRSGLIRLCLACFPAVVILLVGHTHAAMTERWREWKVRLDQPTQILKQQILLPAVLPEFTEAFLKLDIQGGTGHNYDLVIIVNGQEIQRYERGMMADEATVDYLNTYHRDAYRLYMDAQGRTADNLRQWISVPVERALLVAQGSLEIAVQIEHGGGGPHYVEIYGDYPFPDRKTPQKLPAFGLGTTKTSLYKYIVDDDFRVWTDSETDGRQTWERYIPPAPTTSRFFDGQTWTEDDVSPTPGKQTGTYRIRLMLKDHAGNFWIL